MTSEHGSTNLDWFYAHAGRDASGLPSCPCIHQHRTKEDAEKCAARKRLSYICEVRGGKALTDHADERDYDAEGQS